jgi:hypothetical protein
VLPRGRDVGRVSAVHAHSDAVEAHGANRVAAARWHGIGAAELSERGDTDGDAVVELL